MARLFRDKHVPHDPLWPVQLSMLIAIGLQVALPDTFSVGTRYGMPIVELLLLGFLSYTTPRQKVFKSSLRRLNVFLLIMITSAANAYSLAVIVNRLLNGAHLTDAHALIFTAINIFLTNIIIFALWYWEMDGGGPGQRLAIAKYEQDFVFPQHKHEGYRHPNWKPTFVDYLYTSATNAMNFAPADGQPLSRRAKMLMLLQSTISLVVVALVAAKAVGLLS